MLSIMFPSEMQDVMFCQLSTVVLLFPFIIFDGLAPHHVAAGANFALGVIGALYQLLA